MSVVLSPGPAPGAELLQRALDYTRGALATIRPDDLCNPTPCDLWRLGDLLAHMEDALDAFAEAAGGAVGLRSTAPAPLEARVRSLQAKACGLLAAWTSPSSGAVSVGGRPLPADDLARLAALEITVHGWDVGRATGRGHPVPADLAAELVATALRAAADGSGRFARPVAVRADAGAGERVLAVLGRTTAGPVGR